MRTILATLLLLPLCAPAADIREPHAISCISDQSSLQGRHREYQANKQSERAKSWFAEWMMAENFGDMQSKIRFTWKPKGPKGPEISIDTTDKAHNLIRVRSNTKNSLIVVSSASNPLSTESWTFAFNFAVETMIATRVQSNIGGIKGEVITYDCFFERIGASIDRATSAFS